MLFTPWLWVDASGGPHDLIVNVTIDPTWNPGCAIANTHVQSSCRSINATIGSSVVKAEDSQWKPTNETVDVKWVQVTTFCGRASALVMITVKDGHLQHFTEGVAIQAYDPPQFMDASYKSYHQNTMSGC